MELSYVVSDGPYVLTFILLRKYMRLLTRFAINNSFFLTFMTVAPSIASEGCF